MAEQAQANNVKGGGRSVGYPFISLEQAIKRAREFWDFEGKNLVPVSVAVQHWGYAEKSSGGKQTVAALKQFGLMHDTGEGDKRQVRLSPRALDIVLEPADSRKRIQAIQDAALAPKIYADLLKLWQIDALPSDATMASHLLREKDFNRNTVADFIRDFRANLLFANVTSSDTMSELVEHPNPPLPMSGVMKVTQTVIKPDGGNAMGVPKQDIFNMDEGPAVLQWPSKMSAESFEEFKDWIELQMRKIGRSVGK